MTVRSPSYLFPGGEAWLQTEGKTRNSHGYSMNRLSQGLQNYQLEADAAGPSKTPQVPIIVSGKAAEVRPADLDDIVSENAGCAFSLGVRMLPYSAPDRGLGIAFPAPSSQAAEQYRILRTRILQHPMKPQFVLISSATSGDG